MISSLSNSHLLDLWEQSAHQSPARRALCLLAGLSGPSNSVVALPVGERDRRLLLIRKELFGDRIEGVSECPRCSARVELDFLASNILEEPAINTMPNRLVSNGYDVRWRLPTSDDLAELTHEIEADRIRDRLLERCVLEVRHEQLEISPSECPQAVIEEVCEAMSHADPFADIRLDLECPECGVSWKPAFDIGAYLWTEIDAWARRLLWDIHRLAATYGWSERDILALSPQRRELYLDLVEA
jgi:uncharacterized protein (UPF0212 family)